MDLDKVILDSQFPHFQFSASGSSAWSVGGTISTHNEYLTLLPAGSVNTSKQMVLIFATNQNLSGNPIYARTPYSDFVPALWSGNPGFVQIDISYRVQADGSLVLQKYYTSDGGTATVTGAARQYKVVYYVFDMPA